MKGFRWKICFQPLQKISQRYKFQDFWLAYFSILSQQRSRLSLILNESHYLSFRLISSSYSSDSSLRSLFVWTGWKQKEESSDLCYRSLVLQRTLFITKLISPREHFPYNLRSLIILKCLKNAIHFVIAREASSFYKLGHISALDTQR